MNTGLAGRSVVITGGSKGIGLACARLFLEEGCQVAIVSRDSANLEAARAALAAGPDRLLLHPADMGDPGAARAMLKAVEERFGPLDILVNSAGAAKRCSPDDLSPAAYGEAMQSKYFTYINAIDPAVKAMAARGRGVIVNIIGTGGKTASLTHIAGGAANAALMLVTAGLAAAYAPKGVRIVAINPHGTLTERLEAGMRIEAAASGLALAEVKRRALERVPLHRFALPEEVARLVVFLASDAASYITGCSIPMDGGSAPVI